MDSSHFDRLKISLLIIPRLVASWQDSGLFSDEED